MTAKKKRLDVRMRGDAAEVLNRACLELKGKGLTLQEIGDLLHVGREQARQRVSRAAREMSGRKKRRLFMQVGPNEWLRRLETVD